MTGRLRPNPHRASDEQVTAGAVHPVHRRRASRDCAPSVISLWLQGQQL
jgi:hypothetical protein